jgi:hypothetical protein
MSKARMRRKTGGKRRVLALNKSLLPVEFKSPADAFRILCKGNAFIFDTNWMRYTLDEWIYEHVHKKNGGLSLGEFDDDMNTVKYEIPVPGVIVLQYYEKVRPINISPNKENIWKRDGAACAYCKKEITLKECTLDHVHPKSKGGPNIWSNLVASCKECNCKKADELLQDIHDMELSVDPVAPIKTSILYQLEPKEVETIPGFWKHFFVEFQ